MNGDTLRTEVVRRERVPENFQVETGDMGAMTVSTAAKVLLAGNPTLFTLRDNYCNCMSISFFTDDVANPGVGMVPDTFCFRIGLTRDAQYRKASDLFIFNACEVRGTVQVVPLFCLAYYLQVWRIGSTTDWYPNVVFS